MCCFGNFLNVYPARECQLHSCAGSGFRAYRCRATTHLAIYHRQSYERQGSRHKFLAVQPHMFRSDAPGPCAWDGVLMLWDRYPETLAERPYIWCTHHELWITGCMMVCQACHIMIRIMRHGLINLIFKDCAALACHTTPSVIWRRIHTYYVVIKHVLRVGFHVIRAHDTLRAIWHVIRDSCHVLRVRWHAIRDM